MERNRPKIVKELYIHEWTLIEITLLEHIEYIKRNKEKAERNSRFITDADKLVSRYEDAIKETELLLNKIRQ